MGSVLPLNFQTILNWKELMGIGDLHPLEVEALLHLDAAMIGVRGTSEEEKPQKESKEKKTPWPERKGS